MATLLVRTFHLAIPGPDLQAIRAPIRSHAQTWTSGEYNGNRTASGVNGQWTSIGVNPATNRLTNASYDTSGKPDRAACDGGHV